MASPADSRSISAEIDAMLARWRAGDPGDVAYYAAVGAIDSYVPELPPGAGPDAYEDDYICALWGSVNEALLAAGFDPDDEAIRDDISYAVEQAIDNGNAALMVAADGGGSEDYAAAQSFVVASDALAALHANPTANRIVKAVAASRRPCNRARSSRRTAPGRHQGSRRTPSRSAGGGSSGDDDGESEPSRLAPRWRRAIHSTGAAPVEQQATRIRILLGVRL